MSLGSASFAAATLKHSSSHANGRMRKRALLAAAFVLEGHLELHPKHVGFSFLDGDIVFDDACNPQITQRLGSLRNRCRCRILPGFAAAADQRDDFVDALT